MATKTRAKTSNPGAIDEHAADELESYIDNDDPLYKQWQAIVRNLKKHQGKGDYDTERAIDGFMHVVDAAAKKYAKEFQTGKWNDTFNVPTRRSVAVALVDSFEHGRRDEKTMLNPRGRNPSEGDTIRIDAYEAEILSIEDEIGGNGYSVVVEFSKDSPLVESSYVDDVSSGRFHVVRDDKGRWVAYNQSDPGDRGQYVVDGWDEDNPGRGSAGPGKDWHLIIDGPRGNFSTTAWKTKKEAEAEGKSVIAELNEYKPGQYHYRVEYVGAKNNPGRRHMACGDLSKKRCDQLNAVYASSRKRGDSKTRAAKKARGTVRKQIARDKRKGRRSNPDGATTTTTTSPSIRALAARLVNGD